MPQGVSGLFSATVAATASTTAAPWSGDSAGDSASSFDEALDRARTSDSATPASDVLNSSGTVSGPKKSSSGHTAAKKSRASDVAQPKAGKKRPDVPARDPVAQSGTGSEDANASANGDEHPAGRGKSPKKAEPAATPTPADDPATVVQLQNTPAKPETADAANPGARESAGPKRPVGQASKEPPPNSNLPDAQPAADPSSAPNAVQGSNEDAAQVQQAGDLDLQPAQPSKGRLAIQAKQSDAPSSDSAGTAAAVTAQMAGQPGNDAASSDAAPGAADVPAALATEAATPAPRSPAKTSDDLVLQSLVQQHAAHPGAAPAASTSDADATPASPTAQFAEANHAKIVTGIQGHLLPGGGSMQIRLDPPELGAVQVRVEMRDGVMTAFFETSSDQATKLLSHSLGDLKTALEAQGVSVEKLHVSQSSRQQDSSSSSRDGSKDDSQPRQDTAAQQEQQRREMMQRMWRRLMNGQDPLDLVA